LVAEVAELAEESTCAPESDSSMVRVNREDQLETLFASTCSSTEGVSGGTDGSVLFALGSVARLCLVIVVVHLYSGLEFFTPTRPGRLYVVP
jgi:hypothetical protein